jgi:hypothetical protein
MPNKRTKVTRRPNDLTTREEAGEEESQPSLSEVFDIPEFTTLEVVDSENCVQEVLEAGDW